MYHADVVMEIAGEMEIGQMCVNCKWSAVINEAYGRGYYCMLKNKSVEYDGYCEMFEEEIK